MHELQSFDGEIDTDVCDAAKAVRTNIAPAAPRIPHIGTVKTRNNTALVSVRLDWTPDTME